MNLKGKWKYKMRKKIKFFNFKKWRSNENDDGFYRLMLFWRMNIYREIIYTFVGKAVKWKDIYTLLTFNLRMNSKLMFIRHHIHSKWARECFFCYFGLFFCFCFVMVIKLKIIVKIQRVLQLEVWWWIRYYIKKRFSKSEWRNIQTLT